MNVAFVGVGRMGANMARRLQERGFRVTALYDVHRATATSLAQELGSFAGHSLGAVTAAADAIITVVSDDAAMRGIFSASDDNLLKGAEGKLFINCATVSPAVHVEVERLAQAAGKLARVVQHEEEQQRQREGKAQHEQGQQGCPRLRRQPGET